MTETGWPLIPREALPAPVPAAARRPPPRPPQPAEPSRQLPFFGAETTEPAPGDLAGLLAGPGRLGRMGGTARVSVEVDAAWRVHVLVAELVMRGLVVNWRQLQNQILPVRVDAHPGPAGVLQPAEHRHEPESPTPAPSARPAPRSAHTAPREAAADSGQREAADTGSREAADTGPREARRRTGPREAADTGPREAAADSGSRGAADIGPREAAADSGPRGAEDIGQLEAADDFPPDLFPPDDILPPDDDDVFFDDLGPEAMAERRRAARRRAAERSPAADEPTGVDLVEDERDHERGDAGRAIPVQGDLSLPGPRPLDTGKADPTRSAQLGPEITAEPDPNGVTSKGTDHNEAHDTGADRPPAAPKPGFEVLTAYSSRLNGLARAWPEAAAQLFLSGPRLRLWVAAAGEPVPGGYALGLDPAKDPKVIDAALVRAGLAGRLSDDGRHYLIMGKRRLRRLAELVGERPAAAPAELWPGGAGA